MCLVRTLTKHRVEHAEHFLLAQVDVSFVVIYVIGVRQAFVRLGNALYMCAWNAH